MICGHIYRLISLKIWQAIIVSLFIHGAGLASLIMIADSRRLKQSSQRASFPNTDGADAASDRLYIQSVPVVPKSDIEPGTGQSRSSVLSYQALLTPRPDLLTLPRTYSTVAQPKVLASHLVAFSPQVPDSANSRRLQRKRSSATSIDEMSESFGDPKLDGSRRFEFGPANLLEVQFPAIESNGASAITNALSLSMVGGVLMVSTAQPDSRLNGIRLQLEYDQHGKDGERLLISAEGLTATAAMYDWELIPIAKFVDSGHHGAVSIHRFKKHEKIFLASAFQSTLLGLRMIQADMMPHGTLTSHDYLPRDKHGVLLGNGELESTDAESSVAAAAIELERLLVATARSDAHSVLTDANVNFVFTVDEGALRIDGTPYYFFWNPATNRTDVAPLHVRNAVMKRAWPQFAQANPLVIHSIERCFRVAAFLRYQKEKAPDNWHEFMLSINKAVINPVLTPSLLTGR